MWFDGKISVKSILENNKRDIEKIILLNGRRNRDSNYILKLSKNIPVEYLSREEMTKICGHDKHGGYLIKASERKNDEISNAKRILILEGIMDPFNMGDIIRTSYAFGFEAIITNDYDFKESERQVLKSSAGSYDRIMFLKSKQLERTILDLKKDDYNILALHRGDGSYSLSDYVFSEKFALIIGGSYRGISSQILKTANVLIKINYPYTKNALSAVSAASICSYEVFRQRGK